MANNRTFLCCTRCGEDPNIGLDVCLFPLFKYYPLTGWYLDIERTDAAKVAWVDRLAAWLEAHTHETLFGQFLMFYEGDIDEVAQSKQEILAALQAQARAQALEGE